MPGGGPGAKKKKKQILAKIRIIDYDSAYDGAQNLLLLLLLLLTLPLGYARKLHVAAFSASNTFDHILSWSYYDFLF